MGIARFATEKEINDWSDKLLGNHGADSFFQEPAFLELKAQQRISPWRTAYVVHDLGQKRSLYVAYLVKKVYGLGEFWYAPFGPQVSEANELQVVTRAAKSTSSQSVHCGV
jgi:hypothetical protein